MVNCCCVPNCNGNNKNGPKVSVFSFPKDKYLLEKWIKAIHRKDFRPTQSSKVCEMHFNTCDIMRTVEAYNEIGEKLQAPLFRIKLKEGAVPTLLPNCPKYLSVKSSSRESAEERRERCENENLRQAIEESIKTQQKYDKEHKFHTFSDFLDILELFKMPGEWSVVKKSDCVVFLQIETFPVPNITISARVSSNLKLSIFVKDVELKSVNGSNYPINLNDVNVLIESLESLKKLKNMKSSKQSEVISLIDECLSHLEQSMTSSNTEKLKFMKEQLHLLTANKFKAIYTPDFTVLCSIFHAISPHAYKFIRSAGFITLPHPNTLHNLCSTYNSNPNIEQTDANFLNFIKQKFQLLKEEDKIISLMIDEIHIKPYLDYTGGSILGTAYNSQEAATSAHVFMVQSMRSTFKEVIHILPVRSIKAEILFSSIKTVVVGLHEIGFKVICVVSDNNAINRKAMSLFSTPPQLSIVYPHPSDRTHPIFYLFATVHVLKCIRNNWINQKDQDQTITYPMLDDDDNIESLVPASFGCLKELYDIENRTTNLVKFAHRLSLKTLSPSSFERQCVQYVLNVFNEHVVEGLLLMEKEHSIEKFGTTAKFIKHILNWWNIVNVKTMFKDVRLNDKLQMPLAPGQENFKFLETFLYWLDIWREQNLQRNKLTNETHQALTHSTHALIELTKYCVKELNFKYILPGKIQTDALESRFGKYRTMAGTQYLVSLRQVFEVESKIRLQNLLPLTISSNKFGKVQVGINKDIRCDNNPQEDTMNHIPKFTKKFQYEDKDFEKVEEYIPVFTYLAGYCARSVLKKTKCEHCQQFLVTDRSFEIDDFDNQYNLIKNIDRGGLLYPQPDVVNAVILNYVTVQKLIGRDYEKDFLKVRDQRQLIIKLSHEIIDEFECFLNGFTCPSHNKETILHNVLKASSNIMLNNYVKIRNDNLSQNKSKKRKLSTVQH